MISRRTTAPPRLAPFAWVLWLIASVLPLLAYASPLWNNLLADTPIADLIWIPIISVCWAAWNIITRGPTGEAEDAELNLIMGGLLAVIVGTALVLAPERWPATFVHDHAGLLMWPIWIIAMTWLFWGLPATRRIVAPMIYLVLVWPPIFQAIANTTQTVLVSWADGILTAFSHTVSWLAPIQPAGTYSVLYQHRPFLVVVAQACSGADSLLGSAIIVPLVWFLFRGTVRSKLWLTGFALAGALVLNWVRLALLVLAVHVIGPQVTFQDIHPVIGFVLFALLVVFLMILMRPLALRLPRIQQKAPPKLPSWTRMTSGLVVASLAFTFLLPLFSLPQGSFGNPSPVAAYNVRTFLPQLASFSKSSVYYANESSVLGPGSATQADVYALRTGAGQAMVEMWSTRHATALATYGFHACLLYHGDALAATRSFQLVPGVIATAYAVKLPPTKVGGPRSTYVDVEWNQAVMYHGRIHYMRWSIAAFPNSAPAVPHVGSSDHPLTALSPIQAMVAPASSGRWSTTTRSTRSILVALAQTIFERSIYHQRGQQA